MSNDSKYFATTKKGEILELKNDLASLKESVKKEAVKKVIALMTVGKDVSKLFPDVLKCITTTNLELKKLVYLYIMNYAKNNEEMAIMAVNTFQQDCSDPNPLVRALALRTMGCLRVEKIIEYLCDPLQQCLKANHPYVSKTAAICVAKLYAANPDLVTQRGFLDDLKGLLADSNPMVVANAVAALCEIDEVSPEPVFVLNRSTLSKLIAALDESTEWGQCYLLACLARYTPKTSQGAKVIVEKVVPALQHVSPAVVLGAVRVIMKYMDLLEDNQFISVLLKKLKPTLVTMLTREPEIKYVALRNINLILQKRPNLLTNKINAFFREFDDPIYVKLEKLEIMIMLVDEKNVDALLQELKEYAFDVDVEFVRKVIRAIGRAAIKFEKASEKCVNLLMGLLQQQQQNQTARHVTSESIVVLKDIFRRYPGNFENIVPDLVTLADTVEEPEATAAMVWIIGEYVRCIPEPIEALSNYVDNFKDSPSEVQNQVLTAVIKVFLKKSKDEEMKQMLENVLKVATEQVQNPDVRDRGFIYYRLLTQAPEYAKQVVLTTKPLIADNSQILSPTVLNDLLSQISTLSSVYHKLPATFVPKMRTDTKIPTNGKQSVTFTPTDDTPAPSEQAAPPPAAAPGGMMDLLGISTAPSSPPAALFQVPITPAPTPAPAANLPNLGQTAAAPVQSVPLTNLPSVRPVMALVQAADAPGANNLQVEAMLVCVDNTVKLRMIITNQSDKTLDKFLIKFAPNLYKAAPSTQQLAVSPISPGGQGKISVPVVFGQLDRQEAQGTQIHIALKCALGMSTFVVDLPIHLTFLSQGPVSREVYKEKWNSFATETYFQLTTPIRDPAVFKQQLANSNVFFMAQRTTDQQEVLLYFSATMADSTLVLLEVELSSIARFCVNTDQTHYIPSLGASLTAILSPNNTV